MNYLKYIEWRSNLNFEIDNDTFYNIAIPCMEFGYNKALEDTETMLKVLKDRGVISSWYYNGSYHVGNELPR